MALKVAWVNRLVNGKYSRWQMFVKEFYHYTDLTEYFNYKQVELKSDKNKHIPKFYIDIHNIWCKLHNNEPRNAQMVQNEPLWYNKNLTIAGRNGKTKEST